MNRGCFTHLPLEHGSAEVGVVRQIQIAREMQIPVRGMVEQDIRRQQEVSGRHVKQNVGGDGGFHVRNNALCPRRTQGRANIRLVVRNRAVVQHVALDKCLGRDREGEDREGSEGSEHRFRY
ncbi:unnamed protein product [Mycena citricolor]|uniref:Uncharacterized protein n=1 Tax=Mycena citricolor TaxID=2018698 RepID=A0AAD2HGM6_9AGAR|nr:unnamed protein product [Mycena citricolor]